MTGITQHTATTFPPYLLPLHLAFLLLLLLAAFPHQTSSKSNNCEYDMDLTKNVIKVTCQGSSSSVNVYAETAHVTSDEMEPQQQQQHQQDGQPPLGNQGQSMKQTAYPPHSSSTVNDSSNKSRKKDLGLDKGHKHRHKVSRGNGKDSPQKDTGTAKNWDFEKYGNSFSDVVWNATQKLDDAKRRLQDFSTELDAFAGTFNAGDASLESDRQNLRKTSNSASELKESIIVALTNQYQGVKLAILSCNSENMRIVANMRTLVDVTAESLHSALMAHKMTMEQVSQLNATMLALRRMVRNEIRKNRKKPKGQKKPNTPKGMCPKQISAIGTGQSFKIKYGAGAFMIETPNPVDERTVYLMQGSNANDQLLQYDIIEDIDYGIVARYFALPFFCIGTGSVVYRRHFYCHMSESSKVVKYHLKRMDVVSEVVLPDLGNYPYRAGHNTDVDLAVDEMGLWAIYGTEESGGNMVITLIEHQKMEIKKTWTTNYQKQLVGNAFMICGILYATNSHSESPTYIRYIYDTNTSEDKVLRPGQIPFANSARSPLSDEAVRRGEPKQPSNCVMLSYDFRTKKIYSWNDKEIEEFPIYFVPKKDEK